MGRKRKFSAELFDDDSWESEDGELSDEDADAIDLGTPDDHRKTARQRLEDYFEMKQLRQQLGEDPLDDYLAL
jgi:hypothetical protein